MSFTSQEDMCLACEREFYCKRSKSMIKLTDDEEYIPEPLCQHFVLKIKISPQRTLEETLE